jgi:uncharacterized short protein YbdD (DUF466 family)
VFTLYYLGNQSERNKMGETCGKSGDMRCAYRVLVGRPEGSKYLERSRRKWEDNIQMDFREVG